MARGSKKRNLNQEVEIAMREEDELKAVTQEYDSDYAEQRAWFESYKREQEENAYQSWLNQHPELLAFEEAI